MSMLPTFQAAKLYAVEVSGLARDTLHLHVGLTVMLLVAVLFRRSLRSPWPWLAAVAFALLGEFFDWRDNLALGAAWNRAEGLKDFLNTIFWPTVLMLFARLTAVLRR